MSGPGRIVDIVNGRAPNSDDPSRRVLVERDKDKAWRNFYIPYGNEPPIGTAVDWDARHMWWDGGRTSKSYEYDPNAPLR